MRKSPAFTLTAILTLALGIGGNTAIFTLIRGVLLKPLEYRDPDRLVYFSVDNPRRNLQDLSFNSLQFDEIRASTKSFTAVGAYGRPENVMLSKNGEPEALKGARVSANFLDVLGIKPILGRSFLREEDKRGGPPGRDDQRWTCGNADSAAIHSSLARQPRSTRRRTPSSESCRMASHFRSRRRRMGNKTIRVVLPSTTLLGLTLVERLRPLVAASDSGTGARRDERAPTPLHAPPIPAS